MIKCGHLKIYGIRNTIIYLGNYFTGSRSKRKEGSSDVSSSTISTAEMESIVEDLKYQSHRESTKLNYHGIWTAFNRFFLRLDVKPKSWDDRLTLYVAFLIENNRKSSTIKSYVSAIRAVLKRLSIHICKNNEVLATLIRTCRLKNDVIQTRLPIRRGLLEGLIKSISKCFKSPQPYLVILYKALMATAYFGLFRVGELTESEHVVKARDVHIALNKDKLMFILHTSKTHTRG